MEFIDNIKKKDYEDFMKTASYTHFMQSYDFGKIKKTKHYIPHYVGLKENNKIVCMAMLLEKKLIKNYTYFYVPRGFIIDYQNKELLKEFTKYLKEYCKKNHALYLRIDPAIKRFTQDINGKKIDGEDNLELINYLKELGYHHKGFKLGFSDNEQPRFTFRIDIDKPIEDVYKKFHATTRKVLNKGNQYNLEIYKGNVNDIKDFYITMEETSKREGIMQAPIDYYQKFYEIFNKDNMSDLYIAKVNIQKLQTQLNNEIKELQNKECKNDVKIKENENKIRKIKKLLNELNDITEEELTLASIITVKYQDKVWTVHGGNNSKLMSLNANYLVYYEIIKDACKDGYKIVDLFGASGEANPNSSNPIYGIHSFKKRLGGEYTEFIGEFDLITNKFIYHLFNFLNNIRHKIKRKK